VEPDDIIQTISYSDPYNHRESFNLTSYRDRKGLKDDSNPDTMILISRTGNIKLLIYPESEQEYESDFTQGRIVSLQEMMDTIPVGTMLTLEVLRPRLQVRGLLRAEFKASDHQSIKRVYPPFDKIDYLIFGGAVWIQLSTNILDAFGQTKYLCEFQPFGRRYKPRVIVTKIFQGGDIDSIESINTTEIVKSVNGISIHTLEEMKNAILRNFDQCGDYTSIRLRSQKKIVLEFSSTNERDKRIHQSFQITPNDFSKEIWSDIKESC
jgi:hypothetical protein